jgi:hypothetical protein
MARIQLERWSFKPAWYISNFILTLSAIKAGFFFSRLFDFTFFLILLILIMLGDRIHMCYPEVKPWF